MALNQSDNSICNMALAHLGITNFISNITTEQSTEAQVMNQFYRTARDTTLRAIAWPFAKTIGAPLTLVTDFTKVTGTRSQWLYSYRYPANCLRLLRVASVRAQDSRQSRVPFTIQQDASGQLIMTNMACALADYTTQFENAEQFTPDFILAFSFLLAKLSVRALTGGDPYKLGPQMEAEYMKAIAAAANAAINEEQVRPDADSEFITARSQGSVDPESQGVPWFPEPAAQDIE